MTRVSKQEKRRNKNPKKRKNIITEKTGPKKDKLSKGYKEHVNGVENMNLFIPKCS